MTNSDQVVSAQDILRAVMQLRRAGNQETLKLIEQTEPDLAEYMLEELSGIHQTILAIGSKPTQERRLVRRIESMAIVLIMSLRQAHLRLWQHDAATSDLAELDPSLKPKSTEPDGSTPIDKYIAEE